LRVSRGRILRVKERSFIPRLRDRRLVGGLVAAAPWFAAPLILLRRDHHEIAHRLLLTNRERAILSRE
jgi:hypothetical protein